MSGWGRWEGGWASGWVEAVQRNAPRQGMGRQGGGVWQVGTPAASPSASPATPQVQRTTPTPMHSAHLVRASPKSQILRSQVALSRMLEGLRSRCSTEAEWMYLRPRRICGCPTGSRRPTGVQQRLVGRVSPGQQRSCSAWQAAPTPTTPTAPPTILNRLTALPGTQSTAGGRRRGAAWSG